MNRIFALAIIVLLVASNLVLVESALAQSIPKPSVPEFSLKLVDHSYDVPSSSTTTTDPYTGEQTITTHPGYHVKNFTVEISVKNQQFTSSSISNQYSASMYYNVSYKGHYSDEWRYYPSGMYAFDSDAWPRIIPQSSSDYTVIPFGAPDEGKLDIRVQGQLGYYDEYQWRFPAPGQPFDVYVFNGELSGWSSTQTISISDGSVSASSSPNPTITITSTPTPSAMPTSSPTATPTQSGANSAISQSNWVELAGLIGLGVVVALLVVVIAFMSRKIRVLERKLAT